MHNCVLYKHMCFNPRPRMEGDYLVLTTVINLCRFNPRPRMEGDVNISGIIDYRKCFNPRPRMEGDLITWYQTLSLCDVSIHAPAWRAT